MKEDNNPFQPTLAKPADDSVLATDAAADNFLAGNDQFAQRAGVTIDNVKPVPTTDNITTPHLDQMATTANNQTEPTGGMTLGEPITTPDISSFGDLDATPSPTMPKKQLTMLTLPTIKHLSRMFLGRQITTH